MRSADRTLCRSLEDLAKSLEPRSRHIVEAAIARLRALSKKEPTPKLTAAPPIIAATAAPAGVTLIAKAEQRTGDRHAGS